MTNFNQIWSAIVKVVTFLLGCAIMFWETVIDHTDRPWLLAAAISLIGPPAARAIEDLVTKISRLTSSSSVPGGTPPDGMPPGIVLTEQEQIELAKIRAAQQKPK